MKKILFTLPLLFVFFAAFPLHSAEELPTISTEDLSKGIKDKTLSVIDCNMPEVYKKGHIPGAVYMSSSAPEAKVLPKDKNALLVFYCKNPRCMASHRGAEFAKAQGYTNVKVYSLGIDGWEKAGMPIEK